MHTSARLFLGAFLLTGLAGIGPLHAQIPTEIAAELDRMLTQVADAPADRNPAERARRLELLGDVEVRANMLSAAKSAFEEAVSLHDKVGNADREAGPVSIKLANVARLDKRPADADRFVDQAIARLRKGAPQSPEFADALLESARTATSRNDGARAEAAYKEAFEVVTRLQAGSAREAQIAEVLGDYAVRRKDLEGGDTYYSRALAVLEGSSRQSVDYARVSNALAVVAAQRQQYPRAQSLCESSLKIYESQRPDSLEVSQLLTNLGILQMNRGDLAGAEGMFRRSLTIKNAKKGPPEDLGSTHANLGLVLLELGRITDAGGEFKTAIDLRRATAPPLELAVLLNGYAKAERMKGKFDTASTSAREALELRRAQAPNSLLVAASAVELGLAREGAGAFDEAGTLYRDALGIREKLAPNTTDLAEAMERVAVVAAASGDPLAARNAFERAVDAWQRISANSLDHANVIHELGRSSWPVVMRTKACGGCAKR
jgi:tetratricopeptide (TPR) repeat protein